MRQIFTISLCSLAMAGASGTAIAQSAPAAETANGGLEEIIVTATKRNENLQDVPVAVSAISATALQNQGVFETSDLNHAAPNLQVSSPYGQQQPNFSLRGVGVGTEYNANAASPVGVYVDEVYQAFRSSHGQQLYDLNQIEVVRGPQGTLFGRNTTGGAINFITRKPELKGTNGYLTLGYGRFNRINVEGALELTPVDGKVGIRIAGTYVDSKPYLKNIFAAGQVGSVGSNPAVSYPSTGISPGGTKSYGIRGTILFEPHDGLAVSLKGYASKAKGGQEVPIATGRFKNNDIIDRTQTLLVNFLPAFAAHSTVVAVPGAPAGTNLLTLLANSPGVLSYTPPSVSSRQVESDSVGTAISRAEGVVLDIRADLSDSLKLTSISGYDSGLYSQEDNTDCDASPLRLCTIGYRSKFNAFNQDIRLNLDKGPFKLIVGGFYGRDNITADNKPDFFNALSQFNALAGLPQTYFNPAGFFSGAAGPLPASSLPTGITATQHFKQIRTSYAGYAEASYQLTDTIKATAGIRYTSDKTKFREGLTTFFDDTGTARLLTVSDFNNATFGTAYFLQPLRNETGAVVLPAFGAGGLGLPTPGPLERDGNSKRVSGRFILDWKPTDGVLLYASYSRGYRAGTFNGLAYGGSAQVYFVPPESVNAYEFGFKTRFMDNRLQINGSIFYYDYQGQQGQVVDNTATANLIALDGKLKGAELDIQFAATDRIRLTASLGLLDSKYANGDCTKLLAGQVQAGNCVRASSGAAIDVGGNPFPYAAEVSLNLAADWDVVDIGSGKVKLHGDASYTGDFQYDSFGDYSKPGLTTVAQGKFTEGGGDFWNVNARLAYVTDRYSLAVWGKNLTNKVSYPFGISIENLFGNGYRVRSQPVTYGVEATFKF
jgi:iron complex outermembrane recepter protein